LLAKEPSNVKVDLHVKVSEKSQEKLLFWMTHGKEILMMLLNTHTPKKIIKYYVVKQKLPALHIQGVKGFEVFAIVCDNVNQLL
jgi:hypothetical protein